MKWNTQLICAKCDTPFVIQHEQDTFPCFCPFCAADSRKKHINLDEDQVKVLKQLLLVGWANSGCLSWQEYLGTEEHTEDWLNDVVTDITEKVGITPEETW